MRVRGRRVHRRQCSAKVLKAIHHLAHAGRGHRYLQTVGFTVPLLADVAEIPEADALTGLHDLRHQRIVVLDDASHGVWTLHDEFVRELAA